MQMIYAGIMSCLKLLYHFYLKSIYYKKLNKEIE